MTDSTYNSESAGTPAKADGSGSILKDGKIGSVVTALFVIVALYAADALGQVDVSPLPDFLEPLAGGLLTLAVSWFTIKAAPRR